MRKDADTCCLITGASSGIGLAMVQHHLAKRSAPVVAVSRHASSCAALISLTHRYPTLQLVDADITCERQLDALANRLVEEALTPGLIINCVGMLHHPELPSLPEKRLEDVTASGLQASFAANAFAPVLLARALFPLLSRRQQSIFASLSARVGSISDNHLGGWYSYRAAKAAQNQLIRTLAIESRRRWPNLRILLLHPGTTDTPLSRPFQARVPPDKLFDAHWVAARLTDIIERSDQQDHGRFIDWQGKDIDW